MCFKESGYLYNCYGPFSISGGTIDCKVKIVTCYIINISFVRFPCCYIPRIHSTRAVTFDRNTEVTTPACCITEYPWWRIYRERRRVPLPHTWKSKNNIWCGWVWLSYGFGNRCSATWNCRSNRLSNRYKRYIPKSNNM